MHRVVFNTHDGRTTQHNTHNGRTNNNFHHQCLLPGWLGDTYLVNYPSFQDTSIDIICSCIALAVDRSGTINYVHLDHICL